MQSNDYGSIFRSSNSSQSRVTASASTSQSTHYNISPLTEDGADLNFDLANQQPTNDKPEGIDYGQWLNDLVWPNASSGETSFSNSVLEDMTCTMSGALADSMEVSGTSDGSQMSQGLNTLAPTSVPFSTSAPIVAGEQPYADALNPTKQLSVRTSMPSNEATSNPGWQSASRGVDHIDTAMELCETPDRLVPGAEKAFMNHSTKFHTARGIGKQPVRPPRANGPALQTALKQAEKLKARVAKLTAKEDELRAQVKGTQSEKRSLQRKIDEVESEKESLLETLSKIQREVDTWDQDDGESLEADERMASLNTRMHAIKLLLSHC